jgi:hypothetical protein
MLHQPDAALLAAMSRKKLAYERAIGGKLAALFHYSRGVETFAQSGYTEMSAWGAKPGGLKVTGISGSGPVWQPADGVTYGGKPVPGTGGARQLRKQDVSGLLPAGTRPGIFFVTKASFGSGSQYFFTVLGAGGQTVLRFRVDNIGANSIATVCGANMTSYGLDPSLHLYEVCVDEGGAAALFVDGVCRISAYSGLTSPADVTDIVLGGFPAAPFGVSQYTPVYGFYREPLTAAERAALVEAAAAEFGTPLPPALVLGANLKIEYDAARGATISSGRLTALACQRSAHALAPATSGNQPLYNYSDADFGHWPTYVSEFAGEDGLRSVSAHGSDLIPAGSRPYLAWLGTLTAATGIPTEFVASLCPSGGGTADFALYRDRSTTPYCLRVVINGLTQYFDVNFLPSDAKHLLELIYNGTTLELWCDNVLVAQQVSAPALAVAVRRVALGLRADDLRWTNAKHCYFIAAETAPTPAQRAALLPFWRTRGAPV